MPSVLRTVTVSYAHLGHQLRTNTNTNTNKNTVVLILEAIPIRVSRGGIGVGAVQLRLWIPSEFSIAVAIWISLLHAAPKGRLEEAAMACAQAMVVGVSAFQQLNHAAPSSSSSTFGKEHLRLQLEFTSCLAAVRTLVRVGARRCISILAVEERRPGVLFFLELLGVFCDR